MGDSIKIKSVQVDIQENGIIRLSDSGIIVGRLVDNVTYEWIPTEEVEG